MQLFLSDGVYWLKSEYSEQDIPRRAGFRWNRDVRRWETRDTYAARRLIQVATPEVKAHLDAIGEEQERTKALSRAASLDVEIPAPPGVTYFPFQKAGISFCADRPAVLLGDAMGLGKTYQALGMLNMKPDIHTVLVVCPATLKLNWRNEARHVLLPELHYDIAVIDTKWSAQSLRAFFMQGCQRHLMAIINYDILHKFCGTVAFATAGRKRVETLTFLEGFGVDQIIVDEAQYIRTETARRSKAVRGVTAKRKLLLTGTPIVNRPKELFPLLHYLDPFTWNNFYQYGMRFCDGHNNGYGMDFSGASNLPELHDRLRSSLLVRRLKSEVLQEMPLLTRQVIELPCNGAAGAVAREQQAIAARQASLVALRAAVELAKAGEDEEGYALAVKQLKAGAKAAFTEMAALRHDTALAKLPQAIDHIKTCLEETDKLIVFFWHHDVCHALQKELADFHPVTITGEVTSMQARQAAVERFQRDPACRVFLGSITAAGVGITLTAASHEIFVELSWVPGEISQAEKRADRIGQTEPVLVQHLVLEGSLDATMARTIVAKQAVIDAALDSPEPFTVEELDIPEIPATLTKDTSPDVARAATAYVSRKQVEKEAVDIAPGEILRVHRALQYLAGVCDFAHAQDGQGFNMVDARIGHQLAMQASLSPRQAVLGQKIIAKYHRQLAGLECEGLPRTGSPATP